LIIICITQALLWQQIFIYGFWVVGLGEKWLAEGILPDKEMAWRGGSRAKPCEPREKSMNYE